MLSNILVQWCGLDAPIFLKQRFSVFRTPFPYYLYGISTIATYQSISRGAWKWRMTLRSGGHKHQWNRSELAILYTLIYDIVIAVILQYFVYIALSQLYTTQFFLWSAKNHKWFTLSNKICYYITLAKFCMFSISFNINSISDSFRNIVNWNGNKYSNSTGYLF